MFEKKMGLLHLILARKMLDKNQKSAKLKFRRAT
jgi:hypothetical protein